MSTGKNISIVVASDNHYAILIAALLKSIEVNHTSPEHIDFHIIDDGISAKAKEKINRIADPNRITVKWFKSKSIVPSDITIPIDKSAFPLTAYLRVFSPYVVGKDAEKLIYLDVDTIVQGDISELWNTDLKGHIVAAAQDVGKVVSCEFAGVPNYLELGLTADTKYFNSGVLIINPKKWIEEDASAKVIKALSDYKEHVRLADQYGLNVVLANRWLQLDPNWNWFAFEENPSARLVHFLDIKPIFSTYNSKEIWRQEFFRYLNLTPWKGFKPISGNKRFYRKVYNKIKKALMKL